MQLTKFDRWLKERYVYETHIFTLRVPEHGLPEKIHVESVDPNKAGDFKNRIVVTDNKLVDSVLDLLRENKIMYSTHIIDGNHWYNKFLDPKGRSFTWMWFMRLCMYASIGSACFGVYRLFQNKKVVAMLQGAIDEISKGM